MKNHAQRGQSIIEVLIATAVVGGVLTAIAAGLTMSAKTNSQNKQRAIANNYAQETIEMLRRERSNLGFAGLQDALQNGTYCFNQLPETSSELANHGTGACDDADFISDSTFQREADVSIQSDAITVTSRVTWQDNDQRRGVEIPQVLKDIKE